MAFMRKLFNNTRKPQGFLGKMMIKGMNRGHAVVSDWGLSRLPRGDFQEIADFGCGGGRNVGRLLEIYPTAHVTGLDYSEVSVESARKANNREILTGRCEIVQGDVSDLPFPDKYFSLVTAFETIYFWPGPLESFQQVLRVLKPGGKFLVVCESDGESPNDQKWLDMIDGMQVFDKEQQKKLLLEAGFASVEVHHNVTKHYLAVIATKAD